MTEPVDGGDVEATVDGSSRNRRPLIAIVIITLIGAGFIVYGVTRPASDEPLGSARHAVAAACRSAFDELRALPQLTGAATRTDRATRVERENTIFATMLKRFDEQRPADHDGAVALHAWTADWRKLLARRREYALALRSSAPSPEPSFPVEGGAPLTKRMNGYALTNSVEICRTTDLQAEVVDGMRDYPKKPGGI